MARPKFSVVIPTYNRARLIERALRCVVEQSVHPAEIIVVDDGSTDGTGVVAGKAGAMVISHPCNKGNGASVKTGLRHARGEVIVLMDGDGQHDPAEIPKLLGAIGPYDMVVGARVGPSSGSLHRRLANWVYNQFATYMTRTKILDLTSGFRAVKRSVIMRFVYLLPNTFSYPTTSTMALLKAGHSVHFVPITVAKRTGKSKIRLIQDGLRFLVIIFKVSALFSPLRVFLPVSGIMFSTGVLYSLGTIIWEHRFTNMGLLFLIAGMLIFFQGLIAEEIAMLRMEMSEEGH